MRKAKFLMVAAFMLPIIIVNEFVVVAKNDVNVTFIVRDAQSLEVLPGAAVMVKGESKGTITNEGGQAEMPIEENLDYDLEVIYIGYTSLSFHLTMKNGRPFVYYNEENDVSVKDGKVNVMIHLDDELLENATVTARKKFETISALQNERRLSSRAIENIGSREMVLKGLADAQESVAKMPGISIADAGQMIVRGLGDRYSTTTLNGLPIASPNPDNKLIPLDIFPASTIRSITVSKVYDASNFADYSGAHIDISTSKGRDDDFLIASFSTGGYFGTIFNHFKQMNRRSLFISPKMKKEVGESSYSSFKEYAKHNQLFDTNFQVNNGISLPDLKGSVGFGKKWNMGERELNLLASASINSWNEALVDAFHRTYEASSEGMLCTESSYDSYISKLNTAVLLDAEYIYRPHQSVGLTVFYARNATSDYQRRSIFDHLESYDLVGSNSVSHFYTLQDCQLTGKHELAGEKWLLDWGSSFCATSSDEPDRRQVMFSKGADGALKFFNLNQQETQRYFGELEEYEIVGDIRVSRVFDEINKLQFGISIKDKVRNFNTTRFYYNLKKLTDDIANIEDMNSYINDANIESGLIGIDRKLHKRDSYNASNLVGAAFVSSDLSFGDNWTTNVGFRTELSKQSVNYNDDVENRSRSIDAIDLFPAFNAKYKINESSAIRLALSRTITRPSFVEMAPFLYQESFGGTQIRGNEELTNGYNLNIDLRYELFGSKSNEMLSVTTYFKYLDNPIERTQRLSGGAIEQTFQNADEGIAAGVEAEFRKEIIKDLSVNGNVSYIFTNVKLPESGVYTNLTRSLQGASPYLVNIDICYAPTIREGQSIALALLYSVQGPRIHAVGILGLGDEKQMPFHSLDFNANFKLNCHLNFSLGLKNMLNSFVRFIQEIPNAGRTMEVEGWKLGRGISMGISYDF
mgnify:CR=1 FL=1